MGDMRVMLCRNRVKDLAEWKKIFASHAGAHRDAGLQPMSLWRGLEEPDNISFLFEVTDIEKARAFIDDPQAAEAGKMSGVLDGEYHFLESALE